MADSPPDRLSHSQRDEGIQGQIESVSLQLATWKKRERKNFIVCLETLFNFTFRIQFQLQGTCDLLHTLYT